MFKLIIKCLQKENKAQVSKNKNDIKINAQMSKDKITWNVNSKINGA